MNNSAGTPGGGAAGAVYKGLALATRTVGTNANVPFLYATNFRTGKIDVFDGTFGAATVPGAFKDPNVQAGYAPFGIQSINNNLWVTYALQDAAKHDPVNKPARCFVSIFDTDGNLLSHFAQYGHLSSPWGVGLAPSSFGQFANDILVGNFGNGQINAFDPTNGEFLGTLSDASGNPIINPGLWSVTFSGAAGLLALAGSISIIVRHERYRRYRAELKRPEAVSLLAELVEAARSGRLTLVYRAKDFDQPMFEERINGHLRNLRVHSWFRSLTECPL